ncbi:MAG TPA: hypothetical protein PK339_03970 [Flavitalea sp.]|nr:hypothetical protein [Flavitalea sp.]
MQLTPSTLILAGALMASVHSFAQTDSTFFNTGNAILSRDFTQHITVKGEDLERFPFSSLSEAINVYFYGAYTNAGSLTYVIDGNLFNDVNAFSIHDIESITLIQNAQMLLNGADNPKQLVLIKTRTSNARKSGNTIAADIYPGRYQQLYLSKAHNGKRMQVGASLNFMRETGPNVKADSILSYLSPRLSQFRANAWMNTAIGSHSTLTIRINASPARNRFAQERIHNEWEQKDSTYKQTGLIVVPSLRLTTKLGKSWSNEFNASYTYTKEHTDYQIESDFSDFQTLKTSDDKRSAQTIFLREQLQYHKNINGWDIRPSANISFQYTKGNTEINHMKALNGAPDAASRSYSIQKQQSILISPAMHIGYKDWFALQGGIQATISKKQALIPRKTDTIFPFAAASINIIRIIKPESGSSLKVFGSYAKTINPLYGIVTSINGRIVYHLPQNPSNTFTAGSTLQTLNNSLLVAYTYEKRNYDILITWQALNSIGFLETYHYSDATINLPSHRFSVQYTIKNADAMEWRSGINVTGIRPTITYNGGYNLQVGTHQDQYPQQGWSGGWTNHFRFNKITAGLNALYFFDEQRYFRPRFNAPIQSMKANSFLLQHVYLGLKIEKKNLRSEVYASARNLFQNTKSTLARGDIRYLGLGVKAEL